MTVSSLDWHLLRFVQDALADAMISDSCSLQRLFHWQGSLQRHEAE